MVLEAVIAEGSEAFTKRDGVGVGTTGCGLFMGVFRVFKGGVSLSKVAACS